MRLRSFSLFLSFLLLLISFLSYPALIFLPSALFLSSFISPVTSSLSILYWPYLSSFYSSFLFFFFPLLLFLLLLLSSLPLASLLLSFFLSYLIFLFLPSFHLSLSFHPAVSFFLFTFHLSVLLSLFFCFLCFLVPALPFFVSLHTSSPPFLSHVCFSVFYYLSRPHSVTTCLHSSHSLGLSVTRVSHRPGVNRLQKSISQSRTSDVSVQTPPPVKPSKLKQGGRDLKQQEIYLHSCESANQGADKASPYD